MGRRVDGRIAHGKLPRAIEWDDGRAEGDVGCSLRRLNLSLGKGDKNKAGEQWRAESGSDSSSSEPFRWKILQVNIAITIAGWGNAYGRRLYLSLKRH